MILQCFIGFSRNNKINTVISVEEAVLWKCFGWIPSFIFQIKHCSTLSGVRLIFFYFSRIWDKRFRVFYFIHLPPCIPSLFSIYSIFIVQAKPNMSEWRKDEISEENDWEGK